MSQQRPLASLNNPKLSTQYPPLSSQLTTTTIPFSTTQQLQQTRPPSTPSTPTSAQYTYSTSTLQQQQQPLLWAPNTQNQPNQNQFQPIFTPTQNLLTALPPQPALVRGSLQIPANSSIRLHTTNSGLLNPGQSSGTATPSSVPQQHATLSAGLTLLPNIGLNQTTFRPSPNQSTNSSLTLLHHHPNLLHSNSGNNSGHQQAQTPTLSQQLSMTPLSVGQASTPTTSSRQPFLQSSATSTPNSHPIAGQAAQNGMYMQSPHLPYGSKIGTPDSMQSHLAVPNGFMQFGSNLGSKIITDSFYSGFQQPMAPQGYTIPMQPQLVPQSHQQQQQQQQPQPQFQSQYQPQFLPTPQPLTQQFSQQPQHQQQQQHQQQRFSQQAQQLQYYASQQFQASFPQTTPQFGYIVQPDPNQLHQQQYRQYQSPQQPPQQQQQQQQQSLPQQEQQTPPQQPPQPPQSAPSRQTSRHKAQPAQNQSQIQPNNNSSASYPSGHTPSMISTPQFQRFIQVNQNAVQYAERSPIEPISLPPPLPKAKKAVAKKKNTSALSSLANHNNYPFSRVLTTDLYTMLTFTGLDYTLGPPDSGIVIRVQPRIHCCELIYIKLQRAYEKEQLKRNPPPTTTTTKTTTQTQCSDNDKDKDAAQCDDATTALKTSSTTTTTTPYQIPTTFPQPFHHYCYYEAKQRNIDYERKTEELIERRIILDLVNHERLKLIHTEIAVQRGLEQEAQYLTRYQQVIQIQSQALCDTDDLELSLGTTTSPSTTSMLGSPSSSSQSPSSKDVPLSSECTSPPAAIASSDAQSLVQLPPPTPLARNSNNASVSVTPARIVHTNLIPGDPTSERITVTIPTTLVTQLVSQQADGWGKNPLTEARAPYLTEEQLIPAVTPLSATLNIITSGSGATENKPVVQQANNTSLLVQPLQLPHTTPAYNHSTHCASPHCPATSNHNHISLAPYSRNTPLHDLLPLLHKASLAPHDSPLISLHELHNIVQPQTTKADLRRRDLHKEQSSEKAEQAATDNFFAIRDEMMRSDPTTQQLVQNDHQIGASQTFANVIARLSPEDQTILRRYTLIIPVWVLIEDIIPFDFRQPIVDIHLRGLVRAYMIQLTLSQSIVATRADIRGAQVFISKWLNLMLGNPSVKTNVVELYENEDRLRQWLASQQPITIPLSCLEIGDSQGHLSIHGATSTYYEQLELQQQQLELQHIEQQLALDNAVNAKQIEVEEETGRRSRANNSTKRKKPTHTDDYDSSDGDTRSGPSWQYQAPRPIPPPPHQLAQFTTSRDSASSAFSPSFKGSSKGKSGPKGAQHPPSAQSTRKLRQQQQQEEEEDDDQNHLMEQSPLKSNNVQTHQNPTPMQQEYSQQQQQQQEQEQEQNQPMNLTSNDSGNQTDNNDQDQPLLPPQPQSPSQQSQSLTSLGKYDHSKQLLSTPLHKGISIPAMSPLSSANSPISISRPQSGSNSSSTSNWAETSTDNPLPIINYILDIISGASYIVDFCGEMIINATCHPSNSFDSSSSSSNSTPHLASQRPTPPASADSNSNTASNSGVVSHSITDTHSTINSNPNNVHGLALINCRFSDIKEAVVTLQSLILIRQTIGEVDSHFFSHEPPTSWVALRPQLCLSVDARKQQIDTRDQQVISQTGMTRTDISKRYLEKCVLCSVARPTLHLLASRTLRELRTNIDAIIELNGALSIPPFLVHINGRITVLPPDMYELETGSLMFACVVTAEEEECKLPLVDLLCDAVVISIPLVNIYKSLTTEEYYNLHNSHHLSQGYHECFQALLQLSTLATSDSEQTTSSVHHTTFGDETPQSFHRSVESLIPSSAQSTPHFISLDANQSIGALSHLNTDGLEDIASLHHAPFLMDLDQPYLVPPTSKSSGSQSGSTKATTLLHHDLPQLLPQQSAEPLVFTNQQQQQEKEEEEEKEQQQRSQSYNAQPNHLSTTTFMDRSNVSLQPQDSGLIMPNNHQQSYPQVGFTPLQLSASLQPIPFVQSPPLNQLSPSIIVQPQLPQRLPQEEEEEEQPPPPPPARHIPQQQIPPRTSKIQSVKPSSIFSKPKHTAPAATNPPPPNNSHP